MGMGAAQTAFEINRLMQIGEMVEPRGVEPLTS